MLNEKGATMSSRKHVKRHPLKPYKYLVALLYGEFAWMERRIDGSITTPVRKMCLHFKTTPEQLNTALSWLYSIGLISEYSWNGHWFTAKPAVPKQLIREVNYVEKCNTVDERVIETLCPNLRTVDGKS